jgi:small nuclear ribonucleoprotein (snRNP)-like protein
LWTRLPPQLLKARPVFLELPLTNSFFKTLTDQVITVELKNDLCITGTLKSVDQ